MMDNLAARYGHAPYAIRLAARNHVATLSVFLGAQALREALAYAANQCAFYAALGHGDTEPGVYARMWFAALEELA